MKEIFLSIQNKLLSNVSEVKMVDEDWGQLDSYSPNFPAKFPLILIEIVALNYENIGTNKTAVPKQRQTGTGLIVITVANSKLSNTSGNAPRGQKENAWAIQDIIENVHAQLQGWRPTENVGALIRTNYRRIKRDDGVQEYEISYSIGLQNV